MTSHAPIPEGVDPDSAALLRRAYELDNVAEGQQLYQEWAGTYDATMLDGLGYISPRLLVEALAAHASPVPEPTLDLGCGTGLVGAELARNGVGVFDGLDLSASMMEVAAARGIYRTFVAADLTVALPIESDTYGSAVSAGTFTSGHVDASCLDEIVRIIRPGGVFACTVHHTVWQPLGFADGFERLVGTGVLQPVVSRHAAFYEATDDDGLLLLFHKA